VLLIKDLVNIERLKAVSFTEEIENSNLGIPISIKWLSKEHLVTCQ